MAHLGIITWTNSGRQGEMRQRLLAELPTRSTISGWPSKFVEHVCSFSSTFELLAFSLKPQAPASFSFFQKWQINPNLPMYPWVPYSYSTPTYTSIINFGHFLLLICLVLSWLLTQLEELRRWEENYFLRPHKP